jgi:hypothetical protein
MVLTLISFVFGTTYYVDSSKADDSGDGTTAETAEKTITAALADCSDGDTIQFASGTYDLTDEANNYILLNASKSITFSGATSSYSDTVLTNDTDALAGAGCVRLYQVGNKTITLQNITVQTTTAATTILWNCGAANAGTLILDNCYITNAFTTNSNGSCILIADTDANGAARKFICKNGTVIKNLTTGYAWLKATGALLGNIQLDDIDFYSSRTYAFSCPELATIRMTNSGFYNSAGGAGAYCVLLGNDGATNANPLKDVFIENCTFRFTGASGGHGLLCGAGVIHPLIRGCTVYCPSEDSSVNIGIVVKEASTIIDNCVQAERCIYLKGGTGFSKIYNNYLEAHGTYSISCGIQWSNIESEGTTYIPDNNWMKYNKINAYNGAYCLYLVNSGGTPSPNTNDNENYADWNIYNGTTLLYDGVNSTSYNTLTALKDYWVANSTEYSNGDKNSLVGDYGTVIGNFFDGVWYGVPIKDINSSGSGGPLSK